MAERLTIDHVGHRGDGVAIAPRGNVYVPGTLAGEAVEAEPKQPDRASLVSIITASPERIAPFCQVFLRCGGCAIQHWQPEAYRAWKRGLVIDALKHARIGTDVADIVDAHGAGRRRVTIHARRGQSGALQVGFAAAGSHEIVPVEDCPILDPALKGAFDAARTIADALAGKGKPLDIQVRATDGGLDIDVRGSGALDARTTASLAQLAQKLRLARLTRHGELVILLAPPTLVIGKARVTLPPASFLQATIAGEDALARHVLTLCDGARSIADLFCGVGPFALRLAERSRVIAFDSDEGAIAALQKAAPATRGLKPVRAERRDLFRRPLVPQELSEVDAVVFDPPRQGAEAQVRQLAQSKVKRIVAVSCDVQTFARDARILIDGGYRIGTVTPIDQFRHTPHVELVAGFTR